jgi:NAD(P)-dependent dehydrogenase (short-subunit alcohol dehydrogenase family)
VRRKVLVTGGGRGLGSAIVTALASSGFDVDFTYRHSREGAEALIEDLRAGFPEATVTAQALDLSELGSLDIFAETAETTGYFALVHNAVSPTTRWPP